MTGRLRVGTRRSPLARAQTASVLLRLQRAAPSCRFDTVLVDTSGDRDRSVGSSPDFTDALDRALLRGDLDLAVHSAKDLPVELDRRFRILACPRRADPRDCLVIRGGHRTMPLAHGARIGSSSLRRRAQLLRWRSDLRVVEVRGNVDTRIELVRAGKIDAAILAVAGVARLGRIAEVSRILSSRSFLPAPAQGALAVVARADDGTLPSIVSAIDHPGTHACVVAERAFAAALGGDCRMPLGSLATVRGRTVSVAGEVLSVDGRKRFRARARGAVHDAEGVGSRLGRQMAGGGALALLPSRGR